MQIINNLENFFENIKSNFFTKQDIIIFNILEYRKKSTIGYVNINQKNFFFKIVKSENFNKQYSNYLNAKKNVYTPTLHLKYKNNFYGIFIYEIIKKEFFLNYFIDNQNKLETLPINFSNLYEKYIKSLIIAEKRGENDIFFIDRLLPQGRINNFYSNDKFNFKTFLISWNEIKLYRFCIDGILYKETFFEIFQKVYQVCSPSTKRGFWNSHGDIIETNIYFYNEEFAFIDTETYGYNWALSDIVIPLIAFGFMFDYSIPVYQKNISKPLYKVKIERDSKNKIIIINDVGNFNTDNYRKKIIKIFIDNFASPLLNNLKEKEHLFDYTIEEQLKSLIFMRLLAVHNIQLWSCDDQARIFGFIYKIIGTPVNKKVGISIVSRFLNFFN